MNIASIQALLREQKIDGWLIYDFHGNNALLYPFLGLPPTTHATRRFCYWIPAQGEPVQGVHAIEPHLLRHLPGLQRTYLRWQAWETMVHDLLRGARRVAMEYSPRCAVPVISRVDGGTVDLVRSCGVEVVSSGPFLQHFTCVWSPRQYELHIAAKDVLLSALRTAWKEIRRSLDQGRTVTEWDVQQWVLHSFSQGGCTTSAPPICAVGPHTADPHYATSREGASPIREGDLLLIDLWCKREEADAPYADMTRMALVGKSPDEARYQEVFHVVREGQRVATDLIIKRCASGISVQGWEVDHVCREVIEKAGYGELFSHRTGHNIHLEVHGPGANLDSLETQDDRPLLPGTCFSIEPGIYRPGQFGIRLENDVYITHNQQVELTTGEQDQLFSI